jgi:hypothetical protein
MHDQTDDARGHPCPAWCRGTHPPGAHPDDQHHASLPRHSVVLTGDPTLEPDDHTGASGVVGRLVRRINSEQTWVEILSEEGRDVRLVVPLDSARRVRTLLEELLATAET